MKRTILSRRARAGVFFVSLLFVSCKDGTGPDELVGGLAIVPVFESSAAALVPVERLRVFLLRADSVTVAKDTVFDLVPGQDSVDLAINVTLLSTSEQFFLEMQLINAAQDTVFRGGPTIVTASASASDPAVAEIVLVYTGTGSNAAAVQITTTAESALFGETVTLAADALDAIGDPIPGTPIKWSSVDPAAGSFPDDESGAFVAGTVRGPALVAATLLTGPTDTATVMVQPPPSAITITGGDDQTGGIGAALPQPLVVIVTASDALPVEGVEVVFGVAAGNGSLSATSVFTDAQGVAQVTWTLGLVPGAMQATATVPAAGNASVTFVATAQVVTFRWLNTGGGNWSVATNWDLGFVPSAGSTVIIDLAGTYTVNLDVDAAIDMLALGATTGTQTLTIATNSLTLSGAVSTVGTNGVVDLSGSMLAGASGMSVSGTFNWTGGAIDGTGRLSITAAGTATLGGGAKTLSGGRVLENFGTATWVAGDIDAVGSSAIFNSIGGTFDVQGDVQFTQGVGGGSFSNNGSFMRTVGTGAVTLSNRCDNLATADVQTGTLQLNAGGSGGGGTFTVASGATLGFGGGTHTPTTITLAATGTLSVTAGTVDLTGNSTLSGTVLVATPGTLKFNGGTSTLDATSSVSGDGIVEFAAGTATVNGTYAVTGTSTHITGGTVNFENIVTPATTTGLTMSAGTLGGAGQFRVSTTLDWTGGTMTGIGSTWLEATGAATLSGGSKTLDGRAFTNGGGAVVWTLGDVLSGNGSVITNAAVGTIDIQGDVALQFTLGGATPSLVNSGGLTRSVGTGVVSLGANVNNTGAGIIDVQTGTVALTGGGTYMQGVSAVLMGAGTIDVPGDIITGGTINMPLGTVKVGGVLNPTGTVNVGTVVFQGTGPQIVPSALTPYNNVEVTGQTEADGSMTFGGTFVVSGSGVFDLTPLSIATVTVTGNVSVIDDGMINVGGTGRILQANSNLTIANNGDIYVGTGGGVNVSGNFATQDAAVFSMADFGDELNVTGNVTFGGGSTDAMLTGGTIRVGGDFTQTGTNSIESFHAGGSHTVEFNGTGPQTVFFENPGIGMGVMASHFANISISNTTGLVTLNSDVFAHSDLTKFSVATATITGNGNRLAVGGLNARDIQFDHVLLEWNGTPSFPSFGSFVRFINMSFTGYNPTDVQFTITDLGSASPYVMSGLSFANAPTRGVGAYVSTTDSDGDMPNELKVDLTIISPVTCSGADFMALADSEIIINCSTRQFEAISAGGAHACAITATGAAYCWGSNNNGQIGDPAVVTETNVPVAVTGGLSFQQISAGGEHTCGITFTNDGYCWGKDSFGQLGDGGANADQNAPVLVSGSTGMLVQISAGRDHTCAVTTLGNGYCWGRGLEGQLGDGLTTGSPVPVGVTVVTTFKSMSLGTGPSIAVHSCGIESGTNLAYCWGDNGGGQLGDGTNMPRLAPVAVSGGGTYGYISLGRVFTCAVTLAGTGECWGSNPFGQLGDGSTTASNIPVSVAGLSGLDGISTGSDATCASSSGTVYCWGDNAFGQLGDGSMTPSLVPVMVTGGWTLPDIGSAVDDHMCAITGSGAAFCWGRGGNGRLGNGGTADSNVPVLVSGT